MTSELQLARDPFFDPKIDGSTEICKHPLCREHRECEEDHSRNQRG